VCTYFNDVIKTSANDRLLSDPSVNRIMLFSGELKFRNSRFPNPTDTKTVIIIIAKTIHEIS